MLTSYQLFKVTAYIFLARFTFIVSQTAYRPTLVTPLRIRTKLLLLIGGVNSLLAASMYLLNSLAFDRGFSDYLGQQVLAQQTTLISHLEQNYQQHGNWQWLQQQPELMKSWLRQRRIQPPKPPSDESNVPPSFRRPPPEPYERERNLIVLDAKKKPLMGVNFLPPEVVTYALTVNGQTIGYLGYLPRRDMAKTVNSAFQQQQQRMFALIAVAMLIVSILLAWCISQWLNQRLDALTKGTHALTAGDFQRRIAVKGHDEFALLAHDFNQLAQTLADNQQSRQQWIIDISHELRTPLAILQGELEALRDGIRPLSTTHIHSLWQEIIRLSSLVNDLHLLSQADAGSLSYHWQTLDMADIIDEVLTRLSHEFSQHHITIDFQPVSANVRGDNYRLTQLWLNLAQNTLRYTDDNGQLRITMQQQNHQLIIRWEDSSPSVADSDLTRLTERLFRVDDSRQRANGGSGLGLSIVQAIAQAHHMELTASQSTLGGLCWTLQLELVV